MFFQYAIFFANKNTIEYSKVTLLSMLRFARSDCDSDCFYEKFKQVTVDDNPAGIRWIKLVI